MAIDASEFMKELRTLRAGIDPKEKLKQLQELKENSQFVNRDDCETGPFLLIMKAEEKIPEREDN